MILSEEGLYSPRRTEKAEFDSEALLGRAGSCSFLMFDVNGSAEEQKYRLLCFLGEIHL